MQDLGTLGGTSTKATAINVRGQIIGDADTAQGETHAFLWTPRRLVPNGVRWAAGSGLNRVEPGCAV